MEDVERLRAVRTRSTFMRLPLPRPEDPFSVMSNLLRSGRDVGAHHVEQQAFADTPISDAQPA